MTARDFFEQKFAPKIASNPACLLDAGVISKSIALDIEGAGGGQWTFRFDDKGMLSMQSGSASDAAAVISMKDDIFTGMVTGKVNVPMAFITRKIKVKGESSLAAKLGSSLQKLFK
ncbi:MAG: SCP2 sterol-binding domain-containing protein [Bdellovibrionota bacterium]